MQCCSCGGFFPSFAIFALLWGLLIFLGILALFLGYTFGVALFAPPGYSPLLSLLRWLALCVLAADLHLCSSGCGFGVLPGAPSCLSLPFIHLLICFAARKAAKFVSHRSGLVTVYMSKLGSLGENIWGYAGRDLAVVPCWWSLYLCVGFFLWRRSCVSSPPAGGGIGSY